ncbi:citrate synthase [Blattabacterium cuenoti]|uniref:citrate synthase n=1 Tax=Blattabacterium cuenoti TaxID=1653831 RepID=UPI00163C5F7D|nr:citrate synthase [Blattabacterium cuenoti]
MCSVVEFDIDGIPHYFPIVFGTFHDNKAINISKLRENTGLITFDPGFKNTGITKSSISFINGEKGELLYRGYPIEQIAEKCSFLETSYLILNGELPDDVHFRCFSKKIRTRSVLDNEIINFINKIPNSYHPMGILASFTHILHAFSNVHEKYEDLYLDLFAKLPMLAALTYRKKYNLPSLSLDRVVDVDKNIYYTSNILNMFFSNSNYEDYYNNHIIMESLDKLFILHADHEQNCSTTTVRLLGSAHVGLLASISAGISALWGTLHGGANQAVIEMLVGIMNDGGNIEKWINQAKNKNNSFRLMGFGHRIYKNFDPRARIAKKVADHLINKLGIFDPILELAKNLEEKALKDPYFIEKKLYPNIDFYSGIIYQFIGIPKDMFTVMFALGRLPGWIAHWMEMNSNSDPIGRPRQIYVGCKRRNI